jgi:hypothetical protein
MEIMVKVRICCHVCFQNMLVLFLSSFICYCVRLSDFISKESLDMLLFLTPFVRISGSIFGPYYLGLSFL